MVGKWLGVAQLVLLPDITTYTSRSKTPNNGMDSGGKKTIAFFPPVMPTVRQKGGPNV